MEFLIRSSQIIGIGISLLFLTVPAMFFAIKIKKDYIYIPNPPAEDSLKPWKWRQDWIKSYARPEPVYAPYIFLMIALSIIISNFGIIPTARQPTQNPVFNMVYWVIAGLISIISAFLLWSHLRGRMPNFEFAAGKEYFTDKIVGQIVLPEKLSRQSEVEIEVVKSMYVRIGHGSKRRTGIQDIGLIKATSQVQPQGLSTLVPISVDIPKELQPLPTPQSHGEIWEMHVRIKGDGISKKESYKIPVFRTHPTDMPNDPPTEY